MGGAFTGKSTTLDAPTTKTTGAILVTVEFPDLHGATMGILVCACGGSEERMREIASKMNAKVVSMCKCKQAIENKPGAPLKCEDLETVLDRLRIISSSRRMDASTLLLVTAQTVQIQ